MASPASSSVTPPHRKAPSDWPACPLSLTWMVSRGRPCSPYLLETSWESVAPTARCVLTTSASMYTGCGTPGPPALPGALTGSSAAEHAAMSCASRPVSRPWSCACTHVCAAPGRSMAAGVRSFDRSIPESLGFLTAASGSASSMSARPTISWTVAKPSDAMCSRRSSATAKR